ncbi:hypothetical protein [Pararhizobium arenae]|uniref:hypothetical protein n=1 Tax=Pararhizobium arenae TaxID=1856850 RepID=UPI000A58F741|nr:hypothetical protein [Pararhizobium arenae]
MSSHPHQNFLQSLSLRAVNRSAEVLPEFAKKLLKPPTSFMSGRFDPRTENNADSAETPILIDKRWRLSARLRRYPPAGIAVYNWHDGPGAWWRFLKPDQPDSHPSVEEGRPNV